MAVNPTPQSDQNIKISAAPPADETAYTQWSTSTEAANKAGLLGAGVLAGRSDGNSGQLGNHHKSEEQHREEEHRKAATLLLIEKMLECERLKQEYFILQQQITKLEALEEQTREAARLLQEQSGELQHLAAFLNPGDNNETIKQQAETAKKTIEEIKERTQTEFEEKLAHLEKHGSAEDIAKLKEEHKSTMEGLDKAKAIYAEFHTDLENLADINKNLKQKETEIANLQKEISEKHQKAAIHAEKIADLEQQVASLKEKQENAAEIVQEKKKQFAAYAPQPPKTPEEIKLEKAMLEIKSAVNAAGEINGAHLEKILEDLPPGARAQIAEKMAKENIHAVDKTSLSLSYANEIDPIEKKLLLSAFNKAAPLPDMQLGAAPAFTFTRTSKLEMNG